MITNIAPFFVQLQAGNCRALVHIKRLTASKLPHTGCSVRGSHRSTSNFRYMHSSQVLENRGLRLNGISEWSRSELDYVLQITTVGPRVNFHLCVRGAVDVLVLWNWPLGFYFSLPSPQSFEHLPPLWVFRSI
jgi:hypothetical protein